MTNREVVGIIPARLGSTRFPGKVLADRTGKPLIRHVWECASRATRLSRIAIATDDASVREAVEGFGALCVMTSTEHPNGTSRLAQASSILGLAHEDLVVNIQGDEPELDAGAIDAAICMAERDGIDVGTVGSSFLAGEDPADPNIVKVVTRPDGTALYFSRAPIPYPREGAQAVSPLRHVGLYVYSVGFLRLYATLPPTPLEKTESLEQLRVLEHGYRIGVARYDCASVGIDTLEQYEAFVRRATSRG